MKKRICLALLLLVLAMGLTACQQEGLFTGSLLLEGDHQLTRGEGLSGVVLMLDGSFTLEEGAWLTGPVYMLGGRLDSNGLIDKDLSLLNGELILGPQAIIGGDLNLGGGQVEMSPQATIKGRVNTGVGLQVPERPALFHETLLQQLPIMLIQGILLAGLAFVTVRWIPRPIKRVRKAIIEHGLVSAAMGLLVGIVALVLLVLMAFTIILIPISLLAGLAFFVAILFGWIGFGQAVGQFLVGQFKWEFQPAVTAALGTLVFIVVMNLLALIPFVEGIIPILLAVTGLGAVFLTRFGLSEFVPVIDEGGHDF
jgi:hypothetical protein